MGNDDEDVHDWGKGIPRASFFLLLRPRIVLVVAVAVVLVVD
jgi:hypothetical protein